MVSANEHKTKTTWNILRDIKRLSLSMVRLIVTAPDGQGHQSDQEKHGGSQNAIDHFLLGQQVHEIARNQKCLDGRHKHGDGNRDSHTLEMNTIQSDRNDGPGDQCPKHLPVGR